MGWFSSRASQEDASSKPKTPFPAKQMFILGGYLSAPSLAGEHKEQEEAAITTDQTHTDNGDLQQHSAVFANP